MPKNIISAIIGLALTGCGAPVDQEEGFDVGQVEQGIMVKTGSTLTYGVTTSQAHTPCTWTQGSGTVCSVPINSNPGAWFSYCLDKQSFTAAEQARVLAAAQFPRDTLNAAINPRAQTSYLYLVSSCTITPGVDGPDITITKGSVSGNGSLITHYVQTDLDKFGPTLTESPSMPGTYKGHTTAIMYIDLASIIADQGTTTQEDRVLRHALGFGFRNFFGLPGMTVGSQTSYGHTTTNSAVNSRIAGTSNEICRASSYDLSKNPGTFSRNIDSPCGDD